MMTKRDTQRKVIFTVGILLIIFIGPMIAAWSFYTSKAPVMQTVNYGQLLTPPIQFNRFVLQDNDQQAFPKEILLGHWLLFYFTPGSCDTLCVQNLYTMRQVRLALGKDQERVQRLLITYPQADNPDLDKLIDQQYTGTLYALTTISFENIINKQQGGLFLMDPLGNVILYYPPNADPEEVLKDLTRLLRISQIG